VLNRGFFFFFFFLLFLFPFFFFFFFFSGGTLGEVIRTCEEGAQERGQSLTDFHQDRKPTEIVQGQILIETQAILKRTSAQDDACFKVLAPERAPSLARVHWTPEREMPSPKYSSATSRRGLLGVALQFQNWG